VTSSTGRAATRPSAVPSRTCTVTRKEHAMQFDRDLLLLVGVPMVHRLCSSPWPRAGRRHASANAATADDAHRRFLL
jgi:hypothetical protein